jgi:hypothetical protein
MFWKRKVRRVICRDKSSRVVYIDPNEAFPLWFGDSTDGIKVAAKALEQIQVGELNFDKEVHSQIKGLLLEFDGANRSIQLQFRAVYEVYKTNPCDNDVFLRDEVAKIIERESWMRQVQLEANRLNAFLTQSLTSEQLSTLIKEAMRNIREARLPYIPGKVAEEIKRAALEWSKPLRGTGNG